MSFAWSANTRGHYEIRTKFGILNDKYGADNLEKVVLPLTDLQLNETIVETIDLA